MFVVLFVKDGIPIPASQEVNDEYCQRTSINSIFGKLFNPVFIEEQANRDKEVQNPIHDILGIPKSECADYASLPSPQNKMGHGVHEGHSN